MATLTQTGAGALAVTQIAALYKWAFMGWPLPAPDDVTVTLAAGTIVLFHVGYILIERVVQKKFGVTLDIPPPPPLDPNVAAGQPIQQ